VSVIIKVRRPDDVPLRSPSCVQVRLGDGTELEGADGLQAFVARHEVAP